MEQRLRAANLAPSLGALVEGVDLHRELPPSIAEALATLFWTRGVLLFRGQDITAEDQIRLVELFGTVAPMGADGQRYSLLSNVGEQQATGESWLPFHSDLTYTPAPYDVISLAALELNGPAAPTRFASPVGGYAALPDDLKARVAELTSVHVHFHFDGADFVRTNLRALPDQPEYETLADYPRHSWPVVVPHHKTGAPMLFVSEWFSHIEGVGEDESDRLLDELFGFLYAPENVYEHEWAEGDVLVWDNRAVQHSRPSFHDQGAVRVLRKVIAVPDGRSLQELYELAGAKMPGSFSRND